MSMLKVSVGRTVVTALLTIVVMTGCGAWQATKDATTGTTRAIFIAKVKRMRLVISSRAELNRDDQGASLPVTIRVYQLKSAQAFEAATYPQLLHDADTVLKADLLRMSETVLAPSATVTLDAPMVDDAQAVGIVAFFREPDKAAWQLVIARDDWKHTDPVRVTVIGNAMTREDN